MKIDNGVFMLELSVPMAKADDTVYPTVLEDEDSLILVDTGFPGQLLKIYDAFDEEGLAMGKLKKVILTHQDIDHIGNAKLIRDGREKKPEILAHEIEKDYIEGTKAPLKLAKFKENLSKMPSGAEKIYKGMEKGFEMCKLKVDKTFKDGDIIDVLGGVTVIHTPGHTKGHISLYINKYKILIAGDTLTVKDGQLASIDESYNFDDEENKKSIEKLRKYDIKKVICYHGGFIEL